MAIYPGAFYLPVKWAEDSDYLRIDPRHKPTKVILHTAVSNSRNLYPVFQSGSCSHFYVDVDGNVEQYIDTSYFSEADYQGNRTSISIETWDGCNLPGIAGDIMIDRTPWNDRQIAALSKLVRWCCTTHGIPMTRMKDSLATTTGIGYHRLGVPGYKVDGGEEWSKTGKICPGEARIAQIDDVVRATNSTLGWVGRPPLQVDGAMVPATIRRWPELMGTKVDGKLPAPPDLVKAVQRHLNAALPESLAVDGLGIVQGATYQTETVRALQMYLARWMLSVPGGMAYFCDGFISAPTSAAVRALQSKLNTGVF